MRRPEPRSEAEIMPLCPYTWHHHGAPGQLLPSLRTRFTPSFPNCLSLNASLFRFHFYASLVRPKSTAQWIRRQSSRGGGVCKTLRRQRRRSTGRLAVMILFFLLSRCPAIRPPPSLRRSIVVVFAFSGRRKGRRGRKAGRRLHQQQTR